MWASHALFWSSSYRDRMLREMPALEKSNMHNVRAFGHVDYRIHKERRGIKHYCPDKLLVEQKDILGSTIDSTTEPRGWQERFNDFAKR